VRGLGGGGGEGLSKRNLVTRRRENPQKNQPGKVLGKRNGAVWQKRGGAQDFNKEKRRGANDLKRMFCETRVDPTTKK